jgi:acyl carrier protein
MDIEEVKTRLTDIFREAFSDPALVLTDNMTAEDVAAWDSLSHINMIVAVEKGFGIKFTTRDVRSLKKVGDLIALVKQKVG